MWRAHTPAFAQVVNQRLRPILDENVGRVHPRIEQIRQNEIDDPVAASERHSRFTSLRVSGASRLPSPPAITSPRIRRLPRIALILPVVGLYSFSSPCVLPTDARTTPRTLPTRLPRKIRLHSRPDHLRMHLAGHTDRVPRRWRRRGLRVRTVRTNPGSRSSASVAGVTGTTLSARPPTRCTIGTVPYRWLII